MYIILRSFETGQAYRPATALRPGPPQNPSVLGRTNEKGDPCLLSDFASFFSNYVGLPIFQNFRHDFLTRFSTNLTHFSGSFGGRNETHVYRFFCVKSTHLGGTSTYYNLHMWSYSPSPLDPLKGHPNNSAILSIYGMHHYENFATKLWESVGKGHLYERVISAGTREGAPCWCPLSPGARGFAHPEPIGVTPLCYGNCLSSLKHWKQVACKILMSKVAEYRSVKFLINTKQALEQDLNSYCVETDSQHLQKNKKQKHKTKQNKKTKKNPCVSIWIQTGDLCVRNSGLLPLCVYYTKEH